MPKPSKFLTIDPGLGGTGWAIFGQGKLSPEKTGVIHARRGEWPERAGSIVAQLYNAVSELEPGSRVYIELPSFFESTKGMVCATGKEGDDSDLVKLSVLIGRLTDRLGQRLIVSYIRVNEWKGTLPKPVVASRIRSRLGADFKYVNHSDDAVGIGLFVKGVFKANAGTTGRPTRSKPTGESNSRSIKVCYKRPRPDNRQQRV